MKKLFSFLPFVLSISLITAQTPNYQWLRNGTGSGLHTYIIAPDDHHHVYATGPYLDDMGLEGEYITGGPGLNNVDRNIYVAQFDDMGNAKWLRGIVGNTASGNGNSPIGMVADASGSVYVAGTFADDTLYLDNTLLVRVASSFYEPNMFFIKFDSTGTLQWAQRLGGSGSISSLAIDASDNLYVYGTFSGTLQLGTHTLITIAENSFLAKFNAQGQVLWARSIIGAGGTFTSRYMDCDPLGNVYINGSFTGKLVLGSDSLANTNNNGNILAKFSTDGQSVWLRSINKDIGPVWSQRIKVDAQGYAYLTGEVTRDTAYFTVGPDTIFNRPPYGTTGNILVQYSPTGTLQWMRSPAGQIGTQYIDFYLLPLAIDEERNIYTCTYMEWDCNLGGVQYHPTSNTVNDMLLQAYDKNGAFLWASQIPGSGTKDISNMNALATDKQNHLYIGGTFGGPFITFETDTLFRSSNDGVDMYVGQILLPAKVITGIASTEDGVQLYPNPTTGQLYLATGNQPITYCIYSILGQALTTSQPYTGQGIDVSLLPASLYLLQTTTATGTGTARFIKQ